MTGPSSSVIRIPAAAAQAADRFAARVSYVLSRPVPRTEAILRALELAEAASDEDIKNRTL